jgi:DMSO/TMAO reductase YedYZ molybdopterin-dependent catalytic subunit
MAGGLRDKLVAIKQAWAESGRLLTGKLDPEHANRLPPGQRLVTNWPVLDLGIKPDIAKSEWQLAVTGHVANPIVWTWDDLIAQPQVEDMSDLHCVTQWSRFDNRWSGVATHHLLSVVQPLPGANVVILHGADGYSTNVTLERFASDDCVIAHAHDGLPLSRDHGGPVRVIIPRWYFWKSAKWLVRIEVLAVDRPGFWEVRGYHNDGDPWTEQRYS